MCNSRLRKVIDNQAIAVSLCSSRDTHDTCSTRTSRRRGTSRGIRMNVLCTHSFAHFESQPILPVTPPPPLPPPSHAPVDRTLSACYVCICSIITAYLRTILGTHEILMDPWPA